ncbi:uncharacterized protein PRCAT00001330001 [Priceomyces carsonii]|uniref:uncharacterized protein n=1 Tax=Priceomyces carsonii TaxID=28549 RepID=UPI002ED9038E|nr:unnamed protein product [Priceomyces carsonii]
MLRLNFLLVTSVLSPRINLRQAKCIKWFSTHQKNQENPFLYVSEFSDLSKRISENIGPNLSPFMILRAIESCLELQKVFREHNKLSNGPINKINVKIREILTNEAIDFNEDLLREIFLLKLLPSNNITVIESFYEKNPDKYIDVNVSLIALRECLYDGDFKDALTITDLTTGHPNYIKMKNGIMKSGATKLIASAAGLMLFSKFGIQGAIDYGLLSNQWKHFSSLNAMILTYFLNSSFFITLVRFGRQVITAGGDYLTWQKGTFYTHWFKHSDEMLFCRKILSADIELNGGGSSGGEASPDLLEEICRADDTISDGRSLQPGYTRDGKKVRLLQAKDNLEELKLQAYWMSGGDGFEWVEPDQDPAVLIWKKHLSQFNKESITSEGSVKKLKWAEDLIEEK